MSHKCSPPFNFWNVRFFLGSLPYCQSFLLGVETYPDVLKTKLLMRPPRLLLNRHLLVLRFSQVYRFTPTKPESRPGPQKETIVFQFSGVLLLVSGRVPNMMGCGKVWWFWYDLIPPKFMGSVCVMGRYQQVWKNVYIETAPKDGVVLGYLMRNFSGGMYASIYDGSLTKPLLGGVVTSSFVPNSKAMGTDSMDSTLA